MHTCEEVCCILLPSAKKLRQGNIFTSVCQEFCPLGRGVSASVHAGIHPTGRHTLESRHPLADTPSQQTATAANGTYPPGMHSC